VCWCYDIKSKSLYNWWSVSNYVLVSSPLWDLWPDITSCLKVAAMSLWGTLSDERTGLQFAVQSLNGPSRTEPITILYCLIWDSPNMEVEVTLRLTVSQSVSMSWYRVPLWDLWPDIISFRNVAVWNLRSCIYGAPSLTRGRAWNLRCNHSMVQVAQNPKPYFTVSSETPPTWRARFPYLYPSGTEWPSYTPGHWVPFTSSQGGGIVTLPLPGGTGPCIYSLQE
jgi:hypothetical protein